MRAAERKACRQHLQHTFGLDGYRPGQLDTIKAVLSGRDVMCILPTGAGKSLCWQLPAVVREGLTIVVSPLIALMRDQVQHLQARGINALSLDSLMTPQERDAVLSQIRQRTANILFVSPERLQQERFRRLCKETPPWLVVVDEAHCVVQWGEHFRPAYAAVEGFLRQLPQRPVLCAMTATADRKMQRAIAASLGLRRTKRVLLPVVRKNLVYDVHTTLNGTAEILRLCRQHPCRTVVFCRTRLRTERLAALMQGKGLHAGSYHAGMSREERMAAQQKFISGEWDILCATTAFGMGIDVPDIRRIIHDELPDSVIDYVQQTGRAGRDGMKAECILMLEPRHLVNRADLKRKARETGGSRLQRWIKVQKRRQEQHRLMQILLTDACIPSGLARSFGQRSLPCGVCHACRKGALLENVPDIGKMKEWQVRAFLLMWQRNAAALQQNCAPAEVLTDAAVTAAAKRYVFPADAEVPEEMERMLRHFRHEQMHDPSPDWIS